MPKRTLLAGLGGVVLLAVILQLGLGESLPASDVTPDDLARWKTELSNWGRWGADDELGTLNLITPAKRREAAGLIREGHPVSMALAMDPVEAVDNSIPFEQEFYRVGGDEWTIHFHGAGITHVDSLAHIFDDGVTYNGYAPTDEVMLSTGPQRGGVDVMRTGIMTRGILMDIPRLKGVEYLEPGTRIFPEDLEAWEAQAGVRVSAGDALFVRIGRWARRAEVGPWSVHEEVAGLDPSCIPWLRERDVALVGSESSMDVAPPPGDLGRLVLHNFALVYLGIPVLDNMDLTAVSEAAAERNRWEFAVTFTPLIVRGGTGAAVNPIATF